MASNEGDVVLDPFVGGGTTIAVADKLHHFVLVVKTKGGVGRVFIG